MCAFAINIIIKKEQERKTREMEEWKREWERDRKDTENYVYIQHVAPTTTSRQHHDNNNKKSTKKDSENAPSWTQTTERWTVEAI